MKTINKLFLMAGLTLGSLSFQACDDYLDKEYDSSLSEEKVFSNSQLTKQFLTNIYTALPDGVAGFNDTQFLGAFRDCMTDNATSFWGLHYFNKVNTNSYTSIDHPMLGFWNTNFTGIRKCNQFLSYVKEGVISNQQVEGDDNMLYRRYRAEAIFLRALFHFEMVAYFGDAPILVNRDAAESVNPLDQDYGIILSMDNQSQMNLSRENAAVVLEWIAQQCDYIKDVLPFRYSSEGNWGRVSGAAAYALKSRALLYRASSLHNESGDKSIWANAAQAAKDFIVKNQSQVNPHTLHKSYGECFYATPYQNDEIILSRSIWSTNAIDKNLLPESFSGCSGRTNPTQNFVDCFEMSNGKFIDETGSGYDDQDPYSNRDPRLGETIFHHGSVWGRADKSEEHAIDVHFNSATDKGADYRGSMGGTFTGYYLKKHVNPSICFSENTTADHAWIIYRYAEILLNYAEAKAEADGSVSQEALDAVNQVRQRAGMPDYTGANIQSLSDFRKRIRNERRVELSFEDHRYFDIRRWKLFGDGTYSDNTSAPRYDQLVNIYGVEVKVSGSKVKYTYGTNINLEGRELIAPKNFYFPIPYNELQKAPNLGQNPGW